MLDGRQDQSCCCRACDNQGGFGVGLCLSANPCGMQIMAGLNLLRFLLLKGPKDLERTVQRNETGVGNSDIPSICASICLYLGWRKTLSLFDVVVCEATAFRAYQMHMYTYFYCPFFGLRLTSNHRARTHPFSCASPAWRSSMRVLCI